MDGSMHCSNADITGSITASGDNSSISTINGNTRVTLNNGRLVISNGDPSNAKTYRALIGLDNEGNNAWVCMYGTDGYVSDPPVMLSSSGVKGWITNSESSNYRPAICTSTAKENSYVSIICTNGTNQVLIRGLSESNSTSETVAQIRIPLKQRQKPSDYYYINNVDFVVSYQVGSFEFTTGSTAGAKTYTLTFPNKFKSIPVVFATTNQTDPQNYAVSITNKSQTGATICIYNNENGVDKKLTVSWMAIIS